MLRPVRELETTLDTGAKIRTVAFADQRIGLECFNKQGLRTRAVFTREAAGNIAMGFNLLLMGKGDKIQLEWQLVPENQITSYVSDSVPEKRNISVNVPMWLAEDLRQLVSEIETTDSKKIDTINTLKKAIIDAQR